MQNREELRRFLKAARARIMPADVGLPAGERRRTRGLRREEIASLAGMSVTWYTWFEQGRDVQLSAPMLEKLAATLRLNSEEREFLFALAQHRPAPLKATIDKELGPGLQHLLDSIGIPALVIALDWTVIGWNALYSHVFRDYGALPLEDRNLFKILLLNPGYQSDEQAYRAMARRLIARFKWDFSRALDDGSFKAMIENLRAASPVFDEFWQTSEIVAHFEGTHTAAVGDLGTLVFHHTSYAVEQSPSQRLVLFAPQDQDSAASLDVIRQRMKE